NKRYDIEIWQEKFYEESRDCILPIQRILGRFIPSSYKFKR
ncbi:1284_t:CDS:1, partial [Dentiscutata heterogama]